MDGSRVRDYENNWITYDPQPNNAIDAFQTGYQSDTNITLEGGGENSTFLISLSHFDEKGNYPGKRLHANRCIQKLPGISINT
jgi:iron complex outermembrane receptor protein